MIVGREPQPADLADPVVGVGKNAPLPRGRVNLDDPVVPVETGFILVNGDEYVPRGELCVNAAHQKRSHAQNGEWGAASHGFLLHLYDGMRPTKYHTVYRTRLRHCKPEPRCPECGVEIEYKKCVDILAVWYTARRCLPSDWEGDAG